MADKGAVRLVHTNGATVVVPKEKAELLLAGGSFAEESKPAPAKPDGK